MKFLPRIVLVACLPAILWFAPFIRADESGPLAYCPQSVAKGSTKDTVDAGVAVQAAERASGSKLDVAARFFRNWFRMAERTQAKQPDWLSPIATTSGRLKQEFRYDVWRQPTSLGETDYTFGGGKGLEFIVASRFQLMIGPPSYLAHIAAHTRDGFGDMPLMVKFRLASAGPREGEYLLTLLLGATVPTGSNSTRAAAVSPGIAVGKGWGNVDIQSTIGANLPSSDTAIVGRQFFSNTALQYHMPWMLWPEVEVNSTSFFEGKYGGATQVFLTPGVGFGRVRLGRALRFSAGAGLQTAVTRFHTYNHRGVFSIRYSF